jgi:uncharacterized membrane protein required for colicin V production
MEMLRGLIGWILTLVGIVVGVYGAIQFLLGVVDAVREADPGSAVGLTAGGAVSLGLGVLIVWGGRRLRRRRGR